MIASLVHLPLWSSGRAKLFTSSRYGLETALKTLNAPTFYKRFDQFSPVTLTYAGRFGHREHAMVFAGEVVHDATPSDIRVCSNHFGDSCC